jgi:hypothetical protein
VVAVDDIVAAESLVPGSAGLPMKVIRVLENDRDAEGDGFTIVDLSTPLNGTATLDFAAQTITYTANSAAVGNDSFTYTILDLLGRTSTAHVFIRTKLAGQYSGVVSSAANPDTGDPGTPVGELSVRVLANRVAVARLDMLGKSYHFTGTFNDANQFGSVLAWNPRTGMSGGIQLLLRPNGTKWMIEAAIRKNGMPFQSTCVPAE